MSRFFVCNKRLRVLLSSFLSPMLLLVMLWCSEATLVISSFEYCKTKRQSAMTNATQRKEPAILMLAICSSLYSSGIQLPSKGLVRIPGLTSHSLGIVVDSGVASPFTIYTTPYPSFLFTDNLCSGAAINKMSVHGLDLPRVLWGVQGSHVTATGTRLWGLLLLSSLKNEGLPHYSSATSEQALGSASSPESLLFPCSWTTVALGDGRQEYHASHTHRSPAPIPSGRKSRGVWLLGCKWKECVSIYL